MAHTLASQATHIGTPMAVAHANQEIPIGIQTVHLAESVAIQYGTRMELAVVSAEAQSTTIRRKIHHNQLGKGRDFL
jgi:hypothetical protein